MDDFVMNNLNAVQRSRLAKLHIRATNVPEHMTLWRKTLRLSVIKSLQGLRTLHLCFDHDVLTANGDSFQTRDRLTSPFTRCKTLPLRHVTVIFKDSGSGTTSVWPVRRTHGQQLTTAEDLCRKLLKPTKAELALAENELIKAEQIHQTILGLGFKRRVAIS